MAGVTILYFRKEKAVPWSYSFSLWEKAGMRAGGA
jgi:hypothetical protein